MTEAEAQEVTTLIKAATASRVEQSTLNYYNAALLNLDFRLAVEAATIGTITWRRFPPWSEFKEIYRAQERSARPPEKPFIEPPPSAEENSEFKRGSHLADWIHIYYWCRMEREPTTMESFPQQDGHVDPANVMTKERYEELRQEWTQAGSPRYEKPIPMAR